MCGLDWTAWLMQRRVSRLVLALISKETRETLERWQFDITLENEEGDKENAAYVLFRLLFLLYSSIDSSDAQTEIIQRSKVRPLAPVFVFLPTPVNLHHRKEKSMEQIQTEIQAIIRHITASNTFLPLLEEKCTTPPSLVFL
jgi:mitotic spindle assembly checkpoint protein MAD2